jgi:hypothetical protein
MLYDHGQQGAPAWLVLSGSVDITRRDGLDREAPVVTFGPGSWWGHAKGHEIFWLTRAVRDSSDVLVCRLVAGKVTYVHRRLWPAVVRLAGCFAPDDLAALHEVHTRRGRHELRLVPFPRWVPADVKRGARCLSEAEARAALGPWCR